VLLVDDHPIVHQGVERLIERVPGMRMCTGALSGAEGGQIAAIERPRVALLDLHLPDMSAPEAVSVLRSACPGLKIVLFTGDSSRTVGYVAALVGMDGIVHKDNACATLISAIRTVAAGQRFCDPLINSDNALALSYREFQVLERMARGDSNAQIAQHLGLAPNTVKSYVQMLLTRLDARNRLEAVVKAQQVGVL
jgi:two-component system, NarL family, nitrate/nitrite response regulator NarL